MFVLLLRLFLVEVPDEISDIDIFLIDRFERVDLVNRKFGIIWAFAGPVWHWLGLMYPVKLLKIQRLRCHKAIMDHPVVPKHTKVTHFYIKIRR